MVIGSICIKGQVDEGATVKHWLELRHKTVLMLKVFAIALPFKFYTKMLNDF